MTEELQQARRRPATLDPPAGRTRIPRPFGLAMLAEAITLGIASYLHRDGRIPLGFTVIHGEHFPGASTPEAIIGAVLAIGAVFVLAAPARARAAALGTTGFAVFGVLVGVAEVLRGAGAGSPIDPAYHVILLAALVVTLVMLALRRARPGEWAAAGNR